MKNKRVEEPELIDITLTEDPVRETKSANDYSQWAVHKGNKFSPTTETVKGVPPGFYEVGLDSNIGYYLQKKAVNTDELYQLPSEELTDIIDDIQKFWERSNRYREYGFLHKRGILLYGDPGMGKSGIIQLITKHLVENMHGIVINLTNGDQIEWYGELITSFRQIEPTRPIIVILEDVDGIAGEGNWSTSMLLNILDGVKQIDNVVYIATTNYPEKLEERITNRPSRFDRRYEVEPPTEAVRLAYFKNKLTPTDLKGIDLDNWVKETHGMSLAHLRELVISVVAMGNSFESTMQRLNGLKKKPVVKSKKSQKVGFGNSSEI
jgi:AAA+ superfamily predicted ATPase